IDRRANSAAATAKPTLAEKSCKAPQTERLAGRPSSISIMVVMMMVVVMMVMPEVTAERANDDVVMMMVVVMPDDDPRRHLHLVGVLLGLLRRLGVIGPQHCHRVRHRIEQIPVARWFGRLRLRGRRSLSSGDGRQGGGCTKQPRYSLIHVSSERVWTFKKLPRGQSSATRNVPGRILHRRDTGTFRPGHRLAIDADVPPSGGGARTRRHRLVPAPHVDEIVRHREF